MHNNPDADSISSMFTLKRVLEKMNKKVNLAIHYKIPENYKIWFDKYINKVIIPKEKSECLIIVDTPTEEKTYTNYKKLGNYIIVIDHHRNNVKFGHLNVCKNASSTGIILYEFLKDINFKIDKRIAEYLYISLCWDTDGFSNVYATSYVYTVAAELINSGAVPQRVFKYIFNYRKYNELDIQKYLIDKIRKKENITYLKICKNDFSIIDSNDINNFIKYVKSIENLDLFLVFIERKDFIELKMNNNNEIYEYIKKIYGGLYKIKIKENFEKDVQTILDDIFNNFYKKSTKIKYNVYIKK